ncbi:MAG: hypothetical protein H8E98_01955 [Bacteroidetes bacterium]|nr:hypothetical protein [Bacteroidota bacterium]
MKQINIRVGKRTDPLKIRIVNMRNGFTMFGEKFIVTDFSGWRDRAIKDYDGIKYTVTHHKTGYAVIHSKGTIKQTILKAKTFLNLKGHKSVKNVINGLIEINK